MGCEVNGPGEAAQADVGVAFGRGRGVIFKKNKIVGFVDDGISITELIEKLGGVNGT